jgi:peptide/nickel transport system permease protein
MGAFLLRRLTYGIFVLLGVLTLVFVLFTILPGDPARMVLGQRADMASVEAIRQELGLNEPLQMQYLHFLNDISPLSFHKNNVKADNWFFEPTKYGTHLVLFQSSSIVFVLKKPYLRKSYQSRRNVTDILAEAFPMTLILASVSMLFAMVAGVLIGVIAAIINNRLVNRLILVFSVLGMSLPSFFAAILFAWIFAYVFADYTGLSMFGSLYEVDDAGRGEVLRLRNLILPAFTLGIRPLAIIVELTRTTLMEVMSQDYIRTAMAKGLSRTRIIGIHALRNALNPVITAVSGWFASLMAGAVFVEYVFDWKGIGVVIVDALEKYDLPVIMGSVLMIAVILILINIVVDILYGFLDPRARIA